MEVNPVEEKHFIMNLLLLLGYGTSLLIWLGNFTELLPMIGSLLSLGGVMAWVAFFFGVLKDHRKELLKDWFDRLLCKGHTMLVLGFMCLVTGLFLSGFGSVEFESREPSITHFLNLKLEKHKKAKDLRVTPGQIKRKVYWLWWGKSTLDVKTLGLPSQKVKLEAGEVTKVEVPKHLYRQVQLMRLDHRLIQDAIKGRGLRLEVYARAPSDKEARLLGKVDDYQGNSVWIGCTGDVAVPKSLLQLWKLQLAVVEGLSDQDRALIASKWESPISLKTSKTLSGNDILNLRVINKANDTVLNADEPQIVQTKTSGLTKNAFDDFIQVWLVRRKGCVQYFV